MNSVSVKPVRHWFEHGLTALDTDVAHAIAADVFAADFIDHDAVGACTVGRSQWLTAVIDVVRAAFSDIAVRVEHAFASGDLVAIRYHFNGTHTGPFAGVAATGRRVHHSENEIYRVADGLVSESWGEGNWLGTLRQLGALRT